MIRLEPCKMERYPCWNIYRVVSDELLPMRNNQEPLSINNETWYPVDVGLVGLYVVPTYQQQSEIRVCLEAERMR